MENKQLEHKEISIEGRKFPIVIICENIISPENVGMIFRISEAMGVETIYLTGNSVAPPNIKIRKVSRSTDSIVPFKKVENTLELIDNLHSVGYKVLGLEITSSSRLLSHFKFSDKEKYALVIGSEKFGVSAETLQKVNKCIAIELFGRNTSINVVSALGIALYEITKQISPGI